MEVIKNLIIRLGRTGVLFIIGVILIIYIALGLLYWQQGGQQRGLEGQIAKLSLVVARPPPGAEKLQAEYEEVNRALTPMTDIAAIALLVSIAEQNGIDINEASGKFSVPPAGFGQAPVGGGTYQVLSFRNIHVQGGHDNVTAFLADLDSGKTLKTMVLKSVVTSRIEVQPAGEEGAKSETTATLDVDIYTKPKE